MLKEEVEEMKATLNCTEEGRARASAHSKHVVSKAEAAIMCCTVSCTMKASTVVNLLWIQSKIPVFSPQERENQSLITKIASLQEEVPHCPET